MPSKSSQSFGVSSVERLTTPKKARGGLPNPPPFTAVYLMLAGDCQIPRHSLRFILCSRGIAKSPAIHCGLSYARGGLINPPHHGSDLAIRTEQFWGRSRGIDKSPHHGSDLAIRTERSGAGRGWFGFSNPNRAVLGTLAGLRREPSNFITES